MSLRRSQDKSPFEKRGTMTKKTNIGANINKPDYFYETIRNKGFAHVSTVQIFIWQFLGQNYTTIAGICRITVHR